MQLAMFLMGSLDRGAAQFLPGPRHQFLQLLFVLVGQRADGLMPECRFDVLAQLCILTEMTVIEGDRIAQALPDRRCERIFATPCPHARLDLDQAEGTRHFELFAQGSEADAQLATQLVESGESTFGLFMRSQVAQKFR